MKTEKEYTVEILSALQEAIDNGNMTLKQDSLTEFFHAIANTVPTHMYNELTGNNKSILDFNHLANRLVMQNINMVENET